MCVASTTAVFFWSLRHLELKTHVLHSNWSKLSSSDLPVTLNIADTRYLIRVRHGIWYISFPGKEKSNSLALINCVNVFDFCFVLFWFFFFRLAGVLKLRKKLVSLLLKGFVVVVFSLCDLVVSFK